MSMMRRFTGPSPCSLATVTVSPTLTSFRVFIANHPPLLVFIGDQSSFGVSPKQCCGHCSVCNQPIIMRFAMVLSSAMRLSLTWMIRLPAISLTTVTSLSTTNPSSARCSRTSSLPVIFLMVTVSPAFAIVRGIIYSASLLIESEMCGG